MSFTANTEVKTSEVCTKKVEKASVAAVAIGRLSKLKLEIEDHALSGLVLVEK